MKKFIESELEKINQAANQTALASENVLRQIQNFVQSLIAEVAGKDGSEAAEHAVKGLLAIDDFVKKNIDMSMIMKDRAQLISSLLETYEQKKDLLAKVEEKESEGRKIRKIGEKPMGVRQERNIKKEADLYRDHDDQAGDN